MDRRAKGRSTPDGGTHAPGVSTGRPSALGRSHRLGPWGPCGGRLL